MFAWAGETFAVENPIDKVMVRSSLKEKMSGKSGKGDDEWLYNDTQYQLLNFELDK